MSDKLQEILDDRGQDYGDYETMCQVIRNIKDSITNSPNWVDLHPTQKEALEMVATKLGRILVGDPHKKDSWLDIVGYATLALNSIPEPAKPQNRDYDPMATIPANHVDR